MTYNKEDGPVYSMLNGKFTPMAVLLTSGTSYTVPSGATSMKAWAVGGGGGVSYNASGAGGTAFKTWSVTSGSAVTYSIGEGGRNYCVGTPINPPFCNDALDGGNTTITYDGTTITGNGGKAATSSQEYGSGTANYAPGGGYSGGDGGANGGDGTGNPYAGGAVGGNGQTLVECSETDLRRRPATNVSGLLEAVALAGGVATQVCGVTAAFGSSGFAAEKRQPSRSAGFGGGTTSGWQGARIPAGAGAVVLYFT